MALHATRPLSGHPVWHCKGTMMHSFIDQYIRLLVQDIKQKCCSTMP